MTKSELIVRLADHYSQLVAKDAEYAVKAILDAMTISQVKRRRIEIRGIGGFQINYRLPRTGRNPKTGQKVPVPDKYVPISKRAANRASVWTRNRPTRSSSWSAGTGK